MHSRARSLVWVVSVFLGLGHFACGHALAQALRAARAQAGQIRVDGDLGEWRGVKAQTIGDDASGSIEARFAYVDDGLFVGVRVHDEAFVRSAKPSPKEDALVLGVALPDGTSVRASELWLFAGEQGSTRALMQRSDAGRSQLQAVPAAAQIVEGPAEGGYVVEAFVPWGALPGGEAHAFARASLRLHDVDRAGAAAHDVASTHETKPERWPLLELDGGAAGSIANFLRVKSLGGATPKLDWVGTLRANAGLERVLVIGTFVVRASGNGQLAIEDVPVSSAADLRSAEVLDLDGDGVPELVLSLRQRNDLGTRELWQTFDLQSEHARAGFAIETRKETSAGSVSVSLQVRRAARGAAPEIVVRTGEAQGLSPDNYQETAESGAEPILLPWGAVSERVYAWDGSRFAVKSERKNPHAQSASGTGAAGSGKSAGGGAPAAANSVVHPEPPGTDALIAAYRSARGVPASERPRFAQSANLAEDSHIESIAVFGNEVVVVGDGFRSGVGFFYFGLPVQDPRDVQRVFTGDVTGDGRREIFARVKQMVGDVQREILLGYTFAGDELTPILAVEVRRARGADSVGNVVKLVRDGKHFALQIDPGFAHGWTAQSYPFASDRGAARAAAPGAAEGSGIGPLLLPWQDSLLRYRFDGKSLVPR